MKQKKLKQKGTRKNKNTNKNTNIVTVNISKNNNRKKSVTNKTNKTTTADTTPNHTHISYITEHSNNSDNQYIQELIRENEKTNSLFNEYKLHSIAQSEKILKELQERSFLQNHPNEEYKDTLEETALLNRETYSSNFSPFRVTSDPQPGVGLNPPVGLFTPPNKSNNNRDNDELSESTNSIQLKDNTQQNSTTTSAVSNRFRHLARFNPLYQSKNKTDFIVNGEEDTPARNYVVRNNRIHPTSKF